MSPQPSGGAVLDPHSVDHHLSVAEALGQHARVTSGRPHQLLGLARIDPTPKSECAAEVVVPRKKDHDLACPRLLHDSGPTC